MFEDPRGALARLLLATFAYIVDEALDLSLAALAAFLL